MENTSFRRIVIKIGSSSIVNRDLSINKIYMLSIMKVIYTLRQKGIDVALVSSGAIATGMYALGLNKKPREMALKQACAALGQAKLMEEYNKASEYFSLKTGQILVSHDDFQIRKRMLVLSSTLDEMFNQGIIPIINENDALAVEEIKVGDNDTLASLIAPMVHASLLILCSDIDGLYNKNPKLYEDATLIKQVEEINQDIIALGGDSSSMVGTGGMATKISAGKIATSAGINMLIMNANRLEEIASLPEKYPLGTLFLASKKAIPSREHWMIYKTNVCGKIVIDEGLTKALEEKKVSILGKGIVKVEGSFMEGSVLEIVGLDQRKIAKGITKYSDDEIKKVMGLSNLEIKQMGFKHPEIIHADDLVLIKE